MQSLPQHEKMRQRQAQCDYEQCDSGIGTISSSDLILDPHNVLLAHPLLSNFGSSTLRRSPGACCNNENIPIQCSDADDAGVDDQHVYESSHQKTDSNQYQLREDFLESDFSRLTITESHENEGLHSIPQQRSQADSACLFFHPDTHVSSTATTSDNKYVQSTPSLQYNPEDSGQYVLVANDNDNGDNVLAVDLSQQDAEGNTALHVATLGNFTEAAKAFIAIAPVWTLNIQNYLFQTALHLAVLTGQNNVTVALVSKGADVTLQDAVGNTPLHLASLTGNKQAVVTLIAGFGNDTTGIKRYLEMKNKDGHTCLQGLNRKLNTFLFK